MEPFEKKKFLGWSAEGIVGIVFLSLGLIFMVVGGAFWLTEHVQMTEEAVIMVAVFGGIGACFALTGAGLLCWMVHRRSRMMRAWESGNHVMAKIAGVHIQHNVRVGTQNPRVVECHWTDPATGTVHIFYSRPLFFNPEDLLTAGEVPVYLDPEDPKTAFVDIDAVLPKIERHEG